MFGADFMKYENMSKNELLKIIEEKDNKLNKLESVMQALPIGMLLVDSKYKIKRINSSISDMTYTTIEEAIGSSGGKVMRCGNNEMGCGDSPGCSECILRNAVVDTFQNKKSIRSIEGEFDQEINGLKHKKWLKINTEIISDKRSPMVLVTMEDITNEKNRLNLMEYVKKKDKEIKDIKYENKMKTLFLSNISHELKTPLNIIFGLIQLFEKKMKGHDEVRVSKKYISIMKENSYRLIKYINNLIDITKFDSNLVEMRYSNENIVQCIEDVVQSVAEYGMTRKMKILFDTEEEEIKIAIDKKQIDRVILNILSNAIKFSKEEVNIYVRIRREKEKVFIEIEDEGIGIKEENIGKIFERFEQSDTSLMRKTEGSGVGLAITKLIVEAHGGNIYVQSKFQKGTLFSVELPVKLVTESISIENENLNQKSDVEKIKLEFSDIYT